MNILLLTKNYPPQIGGIEKYAFDLYNTLLKETENTQQKTQRNGSDSPLGFSSCEKSGGGGDIVENGGVVENSVNSVPSVKLIAAGPRNEKLQTLVGTIKSKIGKGGSLSFHSIILHCTLYIVHGCYILSELWRLGIFGLRCFTEGLWWMLKMKNVEGRMNNNGGNGINGLNGGNQLNGLNSTNNSLLVWSLDGSIAWIGLILSKVAKLITYNNQPITSRVTIHGTDIVWNNGLYQAIIPKTIAKMDEVYAISENTRQECLKRGIPTEKISLVPHTADTISFTDPGIFDKIEFLKSIGVENPENKIILFSIGRWIERKGFHWFLEHIIPALDPAKYHYILAGFGPYESLYKSIILEKNLQNVTIIWKIDNEILKAKLYKSSNIFIMPNIQVEGNIEGHPLVLLEARYYGLKICIGYVQGADIDENVFCEENDVEKWILHLSHYTNA